RTVTSRWDLALKALLKGTAMMLVCMLLLTAAFVPFGQILGRLFRESPKPLRAYGMNVLGSLIGVWLFTALSVFSLPPVIWFLLGGIGCLPFLKKRLEFFAAIVI